ncbi:hypothetical protein [Kribbella sp. HUAS MG21]|uniref:Uncharacterized protein n=1 Tax=Kribbella sp. HUAS MG21 TaxID=3160966 RepID=A0AAU7TH47_9ACTN
MTQPNADAGQGQPPAGPPIAPGPQAYGPPQNYSPRPPTATNHRERRGIKAVAAGAILFALAFAVLVLPYGLFILGGGGDTEAFADLQRGFAIASAVIAVLALAVLVSGTVTILTARRRSHP